MDSLRIGGATVALMLMVGTSFGQANKSQPPRLATLAQQKMCDEQAKKRFHEGNPHPNQMSGYTSHYDAKVNVCYVMVHDVSVTGGKPGVSDTVFDAFEGRTYASYIWLNSQGKKYWEVKPFECWIKPLGGEKQTCDSSEAFEELVDKDFGIGF